MKVLLDLLKERRSLLDRSAEITSALDRLYVVKSLQDPLVELKSIWRLLMTGKIQRTQNANGKQGRPNGDGLLRVGTNRTSNCRKETLRTDSSTPLAA